MEDHKYKDGRKKSEKKRETNNPWLELLVNFGDLLLYLPRLVMSIVKNIW
ncbi:MULTISPECIES: hypothetical protein [Allobacillus]|nr:hypothetical protein [Allobacillus salarius]